MKYILLVLAIFAISGCNTEDEPKIDAKYLALNNCKYTGESFISTDKVWISQGRMGYWEDQTNRYYVYVCAPGNKKTLSLVRLVIDKE